MAAGERNQISDFEGQDRADGASVLPRGRYLFEFLSESQSRALVAFVA